MGRLPDGPVKIEGFITMYPYGKDRDGKNRLHTFPEGQLPLGG